jgi:hypothetical protein
VRVESVGPGDTQGLGGRGGTITKETDGTGETVEGGGGGKIAEKKIEEFGDFFLAIGEHLSHY